MSRKTVPFNKDIRHSTKKCVALKDEIERLIRARHFKEFLDKPQAANREERPHQLSSERIKKVLTIIGGPHVARESRSACNRYAKEVRNPPQIHVLGTEESPTKNA